MTEEMKEIVESNEKHIIVQAKAGTGKTTTIKEYIKSHPNEKILYTVFSSEMKKEADRSFKGLRNVEVRTFHSLAYRWWVNKNKNTRYLGLDYKQMLKQFKETTQLELKNMFTGYDLEYEDLKYILFYYNMYLCSDKLNIDDLELLDEEHEKYLQFVQMIYDYHKNHYVPVPHNFYLKEYSLSNPVLDVDTLLSDECLDGDMYVKTNKGNIKIKTIHKTIQNGEKLKALSFNHDYGVFEYKSITNSKETLDREIFEIRTEGLNKLRCTDNHRVLTQEGYIEVRDLIVGKHQLILDRKSNKNTKYKLDSDLIYSIEKVKVGSVYDITVEDNHNFIALETTDKSNGMIVHNCQDLSDASLNILLSNLDKKIIAVGDSAQSIFNFMHCKNSLKVLKEKYGFKEYKLTNSFRISDTVAEMCSRLLKWFYEEDMGFRGKNVTKVVKLDILEDYGEPITILSRTRIGGLLEVLNILDKFEDAKIYYYGGLEKYDLKIIENMINNKGFFFIDGERFHVNQLRKMVKEGLDDPVIKGIISRYDFIMKNEDCIELLKRTEVKSIDEANFCVNTLHSCKGSTYSIVKLAEDIGGVGNIKLRYRHYKENNLTYQAREMENQINLLYVGLSRATKYLDIGKAFVKEDKIGDVFELRESLK